MSHADCHGCTEYQQLSRRRFLATSGAAAAFAAIGPAWLPKVALARDYRSSQRDVLVTIFLRGGMDGLSLCVPHGEADYYAARPMLAVPQPGSGSSNAAIDLDGFFGFHPTMAPLMPAYTNGHLLAVHAAGYLGGNRSHFEVERDMEIAAPGQSLTSGWMARHLASIGPINPVAPLRGLGIRADLQQSLLGGPKSLPIPNPGAFTLSGSPSTASARQAVLSTMHNAAAEPLRANALNSIETLNLLQTVDINGYAPAGGANYGFTGMGLALRSAAALIKAQVGVETIAIDLGGWDTHAQHGTFGGTFDMLLAQVVNALAAFYSDLFAGPDPRVTVVVMSEFGRRVDENGGGLDHGYGNCMLLLGQCIMGGRVLADWPGLAPENLYHGLDLHITTDYRDVLSEVIQNRLGNTNVNAVFPGYTPTFRGVTAAC